MDGMTPADVAAVTRNNNGYYGDCYSMGGSWLWVVILFALFGGGGFGWNRNGNGLTQIELQQGFDTQSILRKLDGIQNGLCDGFYAQNSTMLQGFNHLGSAIAENRFAAQQCCCETNRNIDTVRYENAKNTCDIVRAIEKDGEATRALINSNTMQALRDKIVEKDQMLQTANFQLSQQAQTANLIEEIRPCARPAYITCSPYFAQNPYNYGYNYGCGCGCGY